MLLFKKASLFYILLVSAPPPLPFLKSNGCLLQKRWHQRNDFQMQSVHQSVDTGSCPGFVYKLGLEPDSQTKRI